MADSKATTMEEIALKLWALRTGQDAGDSNKLQPYRIAPLNIPERQLEGRAAN
jgi:hypothetical protein